MKSSNALKSLWVLIAASFVVLFLGCDGLENDPGDSTTTRKVTTANSGDPKKTTQSDPTEDIGVADDTDDITPKTDTGGGGPAAESPKENLVLKWTANPESYLIGYKVLAQEKGSADAATLISEMTLDTAGFNSDLPSATIAVKDNTFLNGLAGKEVCFTLRAMISGQESDDSTLSCIQL